MTNTHPIPGLPTDSWTVRERGPWFTPILNGRPLMRRDGKGAAVATFKTLAEAQQAARDLVKAMQA